MSEEVKNGIQIILNKAKIFIKEIGEFAPFGLILKDEKWINLASYDEKLDSIKMRNVLINSIKEDFNSNKIIFGGVCVNATKDNKDLIIVYNTSDGIEWFELFYEYKINKGQLDFYLIDN